MCGVGLCIGIKHFVPIETIELFGVMSIEGMAEDGFRGIVIFLVVQTIHTSEVRDTAFCRYAGASEKDDIIRTIDNSFELYDLLLQIQ